MMSSLASILPEASARAGVEGREGRSILRSRASGLNHRDIMNIKPAFIMDTFWVESHFGAFASFVSEVTVIMLTEVASKQTCRLLTWTHITCG
ncbi:hypothetical protein J6590_021152 [Homalodisca vitripennis]|nr:hypothetical protein J6590_021152 [Homalodisca vitripennis]